MMQPKVKQLIFIPTNYAFKTKEQLTCDMELSGHYVIEINRKSKICIAYIQYHRHSSDKIECDTITKAMAYHQEHFNNFILGKLE
jgi:hypothetical protein